uniref:Exopolyphosphatase n=1 Tax=Acidobacterium capsulatum TaxID=33075 RepID=A0A7V4XRM4_9BACT
MRTFAAIDIGSNSCRLKIARVVQHQLRTVFEDREVTRLGASVFETGLISPEAMANTIQALKRFHKAAQMHSVDRARCVATSAMRDARNARAFRAWVKDETGWEIEIISGLEEGRLIHYGVVSTEQGAAGRCLLMDLGGGSCEITLSEQRRIKAMVSLPLGAVRLTQEFLRSDPPAKEEVARMKQFIARELRRSARKIDTEGVKLVIATSGTAAALAEASAAMLKPSKAAKGRVKARSNAKAVPGHTATAEQVRLLADKLTKLNNEARSGVEGIGTRRSEIIVAGAHVYAELLEHYDLPGFRYSPLGLRDGMLSQMLAEEDARTSAHQQFERERWAGVVELCRRYGVDPRQAEPVRAHAVQMFHDLAAVHQLPEEYELYLEAAAMLRDVGKFLNYQGHHRHAQYIIANSEVYGFTPQQRVITSAIARYLGKSRPTPEGRTMRDVPPEEHEHVKRAVVLLRLAAGLNQDRASDVLKAKARVYPRQVILELLPGRTGAELELWSLRKEAAYFREVFRRDLLVTLP